MPKICYVDTRFHGKSLETIELVNQIVEDYQAQGYNLTLRQVYYQMVSRGYIPNNDKEYKKLGDLINNGRLAGVIDWKAIEDRTRNLRSLAHWDDPKDIIRASAEQFKYNKWAVQDYHVEVWVEKDALVGIVGQIANQLDVSFFSCRGYVSQSEMWSAAQRLISYEEEGKTCLLLHLGDHDPSGRDMSRDIVDRLNLFGASPEFERLGLNYDQIEMYNPPPNPTKLQDTRSAGYIEEFGHECWELDALEPSVITGLIQDAVFGVRDVDLWAAEVEREKEVKKVLHKVSSGWDKVVPFAKSLFGG